MGKIQCAGIEGTKAIGFEKNKSLADLGKWRDRITREADALSDYHDGWMEASGFESDRKRVQRRLGLTDAQFAGLLAGTHKVVRKTPAKPDSK